MGPERHEGCPWNLLKMFKLVKKDEKSIPNVPVRRSRILGGPLVSIEFLHFQLINSRKSDERGNKILQQHFFKTSHSDSKKKPVNY